MNNLDDKTDNRSSMENLFIIEEEMVAGILSNWMAGIQINGFAWIEMDRSRKDRFQSEPT